jgi:XTP/dITP diphosphohydrolase
LTEQAKLLIATNNIGKLREYSLLLSGLSLDLITLKNAGIEAEVKESGSTMEENAVTKAVEYAWLSGLTTLADDSGLEVAALGGEPGVHSRRYAGEDASDVQRNEYLLQKLSHVPPGRRNARFRCIIAIVTPGGLVKTCEGICDGEIAFEPEGENGFGYDPIFYLPDLGRSMAQLSLEEKNRISHRAKAAQKARNLLANIMEKERL